MADNYLERQRDIYETRKATYKQQHSASKARNRLHRFTAPIDHIALPEHFTYPFCYTPHPLCIQAAKEVQDYLTNHKEWHAELAKGKMFGVLVVQTTIGRIGYLAAFSGILAGKNVHPFFVPPVYDLLQPDGFFKIEEKQISQINTEIQLLETDNTYQSLLQQLSHLQQTTQESLAQIRMQFKQAKAVRDQKRKDPYLTPEEAATMIRESQFQKAEYKRQERAWNTQIATLQNRIAHYAEAIHLLKTERKNRSAALQQRLFEHFRFLNYQGKEKSLCDIFAQAIHQTPPAGAGECAAPKLLQYAYLHHWKPLCMAEFWWGDSPQTEIRHHGHFYPACKGKCGPILTHMLQGLDVEENPLMKKDSSIKEKPEIIYEDDWIIIVNKPAGMLSVPGKDDVPSVYSLIREYYPDIEGPLTVHRLDMDTSGLLMIARNKSVHQNLQAQFKNRTVKKRYIALLDGIVDEDQGTIELPLRPDPFDSPRQIVDMIHGKPAYTDYEVLSRDECHTRIAFYPRTGRTHQLRVHAAHLLGLHCPITGDRLYGKAANRLYLHAESLEFVHPVTNEVIHVTKQTPF